MVHKKSYAEELGRIQEWDLTVEGTPHPRAWAVPLPLKGKARRKGMKNMKLFPDRIAQANKSRQYVVSFGGINKNDSFRWGELADSMNLSHDASPFLYPRGERYVETVRLKEMETVVDDEGNETVQEKITDFGLLNPTTLFMHDGVAFVDGTGFYYKGANDEAFEKKFDVTEGKKQIAQLGNYTVVFPDKIWYNSEDDEFGNMAKEFTIPGEYDYKVGVTKYTERYWYLNDPYTLQIQNKTTDSGDGPVKYANNFKNRFEVGETVDVKGVGYIDNDRYDVRGTGVTIKSIEWDDKSDNILYVTFDTPLCGDIPEEVEGEEPITLKVTIPDLEHICCAGGRLWGCEGNRIFASAYLNPRIFTRYNGLSDDSYYIDVTTSGEFTGCAAYSSHVVFFKEDSIHRIYGTRPANFQLSVSGAPGVQKGCWDSVRTINERVFYKGERGIYAYTGNMPILACEALGAERYTDAVAGVKDHKYYISMKDEKENYQLFVFDTEKGTLLREDTTQFLSAAQKNGDLFFFDTSNKLMRISDCSERSDVEWSAELREFNETVNEKKGFSRLSLRYEMEQGAYFKVEAAADNEPFKVVATVTRPGYRVVGIPLPKNRCDKFRIRISGKGECKIHNLVRDFCVSGGVR